MVGFLIANATRVLALRPYGLESVIVHNALVPGSRLHVLESRA